MTLLWWHGGATWVWRAGCGDQRILKNCPVFAEHITRSPWWQCVTRCSSHFLDHENISTKASLTWLSPRLGTQDPVVNDHFPREMAIHLRSHQIGWLYPATSNEFSRYPHQMVVYPIKWFFIYIFISPLSPLSPYIHIKMSIFSDFQGLGVFLNAQESQNDLSRTALWRTNRGISTGKALN